MKKVISFFLRQHKMNLADQTQTLAILFSFHRASNIYVLIIFGSLAQRADYGVQGVLFWMLLWGISENMRDIEI